MSYNLLALKRWLAMEPHRQSQNIHLVSAQVPAIIARLERAEYIEMVAREVIRDEAFCEDEPPTVAALRVVLSENDR